MRMLALVLALVCIAGCSEDNTDKVCVLPENALRDIPSLINIVNDRVTGRPSCVVSSHAKIYSCKYKGETTYYFTNSPQSNSVCISIAYDCRGEEILNAGIDHASWTAFEAERTDEELLWEKD